mmetsp:Transcript_7111/g.11131  ORF Transcript_7111/g.11131 Transcript_7111/m.11131 type:complete len:406 (+) Transcript_7111:333-1550(+)|eukprot:CAMPEP_0201713602 /NCGR_PEP_ID=MMETSP0593-20130828/370_1 /ASSEMBLY_ACC=CAM_ASM_000672 /TAXON_ID=267983 /ORGANISM="Skeletonema japonicum, Strain CCMP2506" /LENGTH=405 /DNA_ID=CAMNT_0048202771 /DNA_START=234 /DNA_END=1451 /DNA_ORIENTATION=-
MPTETTKLGGLLTALTNICEDPPLSPLPPVSPMVPYSDNNIVQQEIVVTTENNALLAVDAPQPNTASVIDATISSSSSVFAAAALPPPPPPQPTDALMGIHNLDVTPAAVHHGPSSPIAANLFSNNTNTQQKPRSSSSKYKPAPPPYPPPGYYKNKEKFLDSDDNIDVDSDEDDDDDEEEDEEVQYFDSFESDEYDASSASRTSSIRSSSGGGRGSMLPTKKNATNRARARSLPSKLRPTPDDDPQPTQKYAKRKNKSSLSNTVSTARPKLGGGGGGISTTTTSTKKSSLLLPQNNNGKMMKQKKREPIQRPTPEDILAGRGGGTNRHDGNIRFRDEARKLRMIYKDGETDRRTKYLISQELVTRVRQYGGRFLEKGRQDGRWYEMDELSARKKASQVLREEKWE